MPSRSLDGAWFHPSRDVHLDPECHSEPLQFNPDRWLDPAARKTTERFFVPFGKCSRSCIGRDLAMLEVSMTTANLLHRFDLALFRTGKKDQEMRYDFFSPFHSDDSKALRVTVNQSRRNVTNLLWASKTAYKELVSEHVEVPLAYDMYQKLIQNTRFHWLQIINSHIALRATKGYGVRVTSSGNSLVCPRFGGPRSSMFHFFPQFMLNRGRTWLALAHRINAGCVCPGTEGSPT